MVTVRATYLRYAADSTLRSMDTERFPEIIALLRLGDCALRVNRLLPPFPRPAARTLYRLIHGVGFGKRYRQFRGSMVDGALGMLEPDFWPFRGRSFVETGWLIQISE